MWCSIPKLPDLDTLFSGLLFKKTKVSAVPSKLAPGPQTALCVFAQPTGEVSCACICDLPFAAYSASALIMVPPAGANDHVRSGKFTPALLENFAEVMNVLSSKLTESPNRVILRYPVVTANAVPDDTKALLQKPEARAEFEVDITGYGKGRFAVYAA